MRVSHSPYQNRLLAGLPVAESERLSPYLELVRLPLGQVLHDIGDRLRHVYFPTGSVISLYVMADGVSADMAVIGNEGIIGIGLSMGGQSMHNRAVVQRGGYAYRLEGRLLQEEFNRAGELQHLLLCYTQALLTQMSQTAVCNRYHSLDQQLCRWLLLSLDRLPSNELVMTQELLANMLGVRRGGVEGAASKLQSDGLIHYDRGHIIVVDRPRVEARVCECYHVVKAESERLLPYASARC